MGLGFWGGLAAGAVVVMVVGPYLLGRGIGAVFGWRGTSTARVDALLLRTRSGLFGLLVAGGVVAAVLVAAVLVRLWASVPRPVVVAQIALVTTLVTAVADRALQRGLEPTLAVHREGEATVPPGVRRRERLLPLVMPLVIGALGAAALLGYAPILPWLVVGVVALLPVYQWPVFPLNAPGSPIFSALARDPTADERSRIEVCYERFDRTVPRIRVRPGSGVLGSVAVTGSGAARSLTVEAPFLDRVDDDTLAAALATADEQGRRRFYPLLFTLQVPLLFTLVYSVVEFVRIDGISVVWLGVFGGAFLGLLGVSALVRPRVFAADAFAASHLGDQAVVDALHRVGDDITTFSGWRQDVPVVGGFVDRLRPEPPIDVRIDRFDADPPAETGPGGDAETGNRPGPAPGTGSPDARRGSAGTDGRAGQGPASSARPGGAERRADASDHPADRPSQPTGRDVGRRGAAGGGHPESGAADRPRQRADRPAHAGPAGSPDRPADPDRPDTRWKKGILASTLVLLLTLPVVLVGAGPDAVVRAPVTAPPVLQGLAALAVVAAWLALPVAMYKDSEETRPLTGWPKYRKSYLLGSLLLPYNLLVVGLYLWKRPSLPTAGTRDRRPPADRGADAGRGGRHGAPPSDDAGRSGGRHGDSQRRQ